MNHRLALSGVAKVLVPAIGLFLLLAIGAAWLIPRGPEAAYLPDLVVWDGPDDVLYVARHEVTIAEWNRCVDAGACAIRLVARPGFDPERTPATGVNWQDASAYAGWISKRARHPLRLPRSAEWLAMAAPVLPDKPNPIFTDPELSWASAYLTEAEYPRALRPTGSFSVTEEGIADLDGPVWEWTSDCYDPAIPDTRCPAFMAGGLHLSVIALYTRDPARGGCAVGAPPAHLGLRLVSDRAPGS